MRVQGRKLGPESETADGEQDHRQQVVAVAGEAE